MLDHDEAIDLTRSDEPVAESSSPTPSRPMDRRELAELVCKTLAFVMFAIAAVISATAVLLANFMLIGLFFDGNYYAYDFVSNLILGVPALATLGVGFVYWKKSKSIAACMVSADPTPVAVGAFTVQDAMTVAFSTAGLYFLLAAARSFVGMAYIAQQYSVDPGEFWYGIETWSTVLQAAMALWLILGSKGIVAAIHWCQTAGIRDAESE